MESNSSNNGRSYSVFDRNNIFPIMSGGVNDPHDRPCLFPSARVTVKDSKRDNDPDWLENRSFTAETAKKFVEFQQEVKKLQNKDEQATIDVKSTEHVLVTNQFDTVRSTNPVSYNITISEDSSDTESYARAKKKHYQDNAHHKKKKRKRYYSSDEDYDKHSRKKDTSDGSDVDSRKKKKRSKKHKRKKTYKKENKEGEHKRTKDDIVGLFVSKHIFVDDVADIAPEHAFKLDREPDKNNWTYGSLYSGHIANYRTGCNQCVGGDRKTVVFMKDHSKKTKDKQSVDRYYSKDNRQRIREATVEITGKTWNAPKIDTLQDYVSVLDISVDFNSDRNMDIRDKVLDEATTLYVSGKGKHMDDASNADMDSAPYNPLRQKVSEFNKKLRETPEDIELWMKFIEFQDRLHNDGNKLEIDSQEKITANGIFEKKLSILDKALDHNPGNIKLLLTKIKLSAEISDSSKVNKEIEDLLFVHSANAQLWRYYLTFNQSRLSTLSVTKMTKLYHKCFNTLFRILEGKMITARTSDDLEQEILDIFLQYCYFLKQSGCKEHAIAVFQAMLEYNFFVPSSLKAASNEVRMAAFAEFWDSNCARIGTLGALGWSKWFESGRPENFLNPNDDGLEELEESIIEKKNPKYSTWLQIEHLRDRHHWLPWQPAQGQTLDDCGDEDMERLFLFDDIAPVLFTISESKRLQFVMSYLRFLGFQSNMDKTGARHMDNIYDESLTDVICDVDKGCSIQNVLNIQDRSLPRQIAIHTLNQLITFFADDKRSQMTLTLIAVHLSKYSGTDLSKQDKKEMRKILKNILKDEHNRNDLNVWCSFIELERWIGKTGEAQSVIETALSMHSGESIENMNEKVNGIISMYVQYCEILLKIEHSMPCKMFSKVSPISMNTKMKVMSILGILVDSAKFSTKDIPIISGTAVLRVMAKYSKLCTNTYERVCSSTSELYGERLRKLTWCYSLCMFCKGDVNSSLENYSSLISQISKNKVDNSKQLELELSLDKLRLILYYLSTSTVSLHVLRDHLDSTLEKFPDNSILMSLFVDVERRSRISGRLNKYFDKWCRTGDSIIPAVYAVINQLAFLEQTGSTDEFGIGTSGLVHRARSWLEHSLTQEGLQHCVLLWRIYLQLEKSVGDVSRMKGLFYRAVQHCPWAKIIYTDGIQMFGDDQLQEIVDLMTEKHIQVQIPVEELDILMSS